ncbi:sulfate/molybdate ABC transporter ATP-binding protein [Roseateles amylovorans]|uniref:Sulfate ABC transporter ATP-binding protein n=1 Tax=Roseateles amylovorans TaxID=2978473 RepID=A0ABY6AZP3_9BURK|nr:sulfate ABC transporter ATP-binding protein [Roseateles amylovorans]UXH78432.1 sulfate ABC transporter ATP-binding protein [Roseateles amylovorans]
MSIQVRNIHKSFGAFTALGDVSLDFPTGELTALLGPSGCGKTTLLRIIAGLETADRGQVLLDGTDASDTHVREREVGFVFQHYALFRHMTVFDNVAFGLRVKPRKHRPPEAEIKRKVHELLQLVQLDWLADRYPPQLSGGQRQRIALARALAVEPRVLLLDEPFGALDAKVRKELRRWLRRLHDELHITSVFVTHDQEEALEVADRVVLMDHGRVEQVGSPTEVYERPATPFVYGFLGAVNRFEGRSEGGVVRVGEQTLAQDLAGAAQPQGLVQAYARPHELRIVLSQDAPGLPATVERVLSFGAAARIELRGPQGEHLEAEVSREQAEALQLASGQQVRLQASRLSLFATQAA